MMFTHRRRSNIIATAHGLIQRLLHATRVIDHHPTVHHQFDLTCNHIDIRYLPKSSLEIRWWVESAASSAKHRE